MKNVLLLILITSIVSCSPKMVEQTLQEELESKSIDEFGTRAVSLDDEQDSHLVRHIYQTSNIITIMDHVVLKDSTYVLTLSEASMRELKMSIKERTFAKDYVRLLNETVRTSCYIND